MKQICLLAIISLGLIQCKKNDTAEPAQHTIVLQPGPESGSRYVQQIIPVNTEKNTGVQDGTGSAGEDLLVAARWNSLIHPEQQDWRSFLRFNELSTIPQDAKLVSARLYLSGVSSSRLFPDGNTSLPGFRRSDNTSVIQRLTTDWSNQEINWFNMPHATEEGQVTIAASDRQWNYDVVLDVTDMVRKMVAEPKENYGFMIRLLNDYDYTALLFASSSSKDVASRPKLVVEAIY